MKIGHRGLFISKAESAPPHSLLPSGEGGWRTDSKDSGQTENTGGHKGSGGCHRQK